MWVLILFGIKPSELVAGMLICDHIKKNLCDDFSVLANVDTTVNHTTENLNWHMHICYLYASLSKVYYIIKFLKDVTSFQMVGTIYYAYFQSRMKFWERDRNSVNVYHVQKKIIWLISGVKTCDPCRHIFMEYRILTVASVYILEVLCFIKKFKGYLKLNFCIHRYNKRSNINLHMPSCYTALFQKTVVNISVKL
jgi:hypothetical protein